MNQVIIIGEVICINKEEKEFDISIPRSKYPTMDDIKSDIFKCKGCNVLHRNITSLIKINDKILIKWRIQEQSDKYYILVESYQVLQRKV